MWRTRQYSLSMAPSLGWSRPWPPGESSSWLPSSEPSSLPNGARPKQVVCGERRTLVLTEEGALLVCGRNNEDRPSRLLSGGILYVSKDSEPSGQRAWPMLCTCSPRGSPVSQEAKSAS
mmetsp:Transcript_11024/g.32431  ORF Transcript_11024/g.32431 Transcript_11024/m.32431 type:complete len:119 (+) Transcript_11024:67-423(+)